jgi:hypothetical protein
VSTAIITTTGKRVAAVIAIASLAAVTGGVARYDDGDAPAPPTAAGPLVPPRAEETKPTTGSTFTLEVVDRCDRSPLTGATVWVRAILGRTRAWEGTTDRSAQLCRCPGLLMLGDDLLRRPRVTGVLRAS